MDKYKKRMKQKKFNSSSHGVLRSPSMNDLIFKPICSSLFSCIEIIISLCNAQHYVVWKAKNIPKTIPNEYLWTKCKRHNAKEKCKQNVKDTMPKENANKM